MARATNVRAGASTRYAAASNPQPSGVSNGTPGGRSKLRPGRRASLAIGDEMYLWVLVFLEVGTMAYLRKQFRRHHGG